MAVSPQVLNLLAEGTTLVIGRTRAELSRFEEECAKHGLGESDVPQDHSDNLKDRASTATGVFDTLSSIAESPTAIARLSREKS